MLRSIEYYVRVLAWQQTKDGVDGHNEPQPIQTPGEVKRTKAEREEVIAGRAFVDRVLGFSKEGENKWPTSTSAPLTSP